MDHVLVFDIESVADLPCVARVHGCPEGDDEAAREALGGKFPKLIFHKIVALGALIAERREDGWHVLSLGAPHIGERTEAEMLTAFCERIGQFRPRLVGWNCASFDLPVLRYRSMINRVAAPGLEGRRYWYRYGDDSLDLCDALACYEGRGKVALHDLCRALGFPGKPSDIDGSEVERYVQEGRIAEVAEYCQTDVASTYRVWLVHELFRGGLTKAEFEVSEANLLGFVRERIEAKPYLAHLLGSASASGAHSLDPPHAYGGAWYPAEHAEKADVLP